MRHIWVTLCLLASTLAAGLFPSELTVGKTDYAIRSLDFQQGAVTVMEYTERLEEDLTVQHRNYQIYDGAYVWMGHAVAEKTKKAQRLSAFSIPAGEGTLRIYDKDDHQWHMSPLQNAHVSASCIVISLEQGGEYMILSPKVYAPQGAGTLCYLPEWSGSVRITCSEEDNHLSLQTLRIPAGAVADYTVIYSPEGLLDWDDPAELEYWNGSVLDITGQWCFDGYYYPSPTTYVPTGVQFYYRNTAAYLCRNVSWGLDTTNVSRTLTIAMLDTMALQQNSYGYFPTLPRSTWLSGSYEVPGGFYDTRFNSDLAEIYYAAAQWNPCVQFDETMERYFDFFLTFAEEHHWETEHGGWLVEDYWSPGGSKPLHTSLNHQLAEILTMYHFSEYLERPELGELADKMLLAVRDTAPDWIKKDSNLHYSYRPNGTYGGNDYPYLTYNDLYHLQQYLQTKGCEEAALQTLMDAKKIWMDRQHVTEYLK